jgi:hypothetical protein
MAVVPIQAVIGEAGLSEKQRALSDHLRRCTTSFVFSNWIGVKDTSALGVAEDAVYHFPAADDSTNGIGVDDIPVFRHKIRWENEEGDL